MDLGNHQLLNDIFTCRCFPQAVQHPMDPPAGGCPTGPSRPWHNSQQVEQSLPSEACLYWLANSLSLAKGLASISHRAPGRWLSVHLPPRSLLAPIVDDSHDWIPTKRSVCIHCRHMDIWAWHQHCHVSSQTNAPHQIVP